MKLLAALASLFFLEVALSQGDVHKAAQRVGDNGLAIRAEIEDPVGVAVEDSQTLYIAEHDNVIRRVDLKSGIITTLKTTSELDSIGSLALDSAGNLIAVEFAANRIVSIDKSGVVSTIAGNGTFVFSGDGGPAINAGLNYPSQITLDATNNVYIADGGNGRVRRVDARTGIITTVAGSGKRDSSGDGGDALGAGLDWPDGVALDRDGNLYISEHSGIRRVDSKTNTITTIAGNAENASSLLFDLDERLIFVDPVNDRVRSVDTKTGVITTIAGSTKGFGGDGGPAIKAHFNNPNAIALDTEGNLYIAEFVNHRIRRVEARSRNVKTVAGSGEPHHLHISL